MAERPPATAAQINPSLSASAPQVHIRYSVVTAAYTGLRWGELGRTARANTRLGDGLIHVHPEVGALHEVRGRLYLGPPKTAASARDIHLPPFLVHLPPGQLDSHDHELVFSGARGSPGCAAPPCPAGWGGPPLTAPPARTHHPRGMHFHDTRHTHKTWLIEDDIPEIAQARRLGHRLPGIRGVYSHVTPVMIARITNSLQARWQASHTPTPLPQRHLHAA